MIRILLFLVFSFQLLSNSTSQTNEAVWLDTILSKLKANDVNYFTSRIQATHGTKINTAQISKAVNQLSVLLRIVTTLDSLPLEVKNTKKLTRFGELEFKSFIYKIESLDSRSPIFQTNCIYRSMNLRLSAVCQNQRE